MAIDRNVIVPIPPEANHPKGGKNTRIFITTQTIYNPEKKYNTDKRVTIGTAVSETEMYPNDSYKLMFPQEYNAHAPHDQKLPEQTKIIGPYASMLAIGQLTGLYSVLIKSFGCQSANMIMDYGMYSIITHSNAAKDFKNTMQKFLLFSDKPYSDTWISGFFKETMTDNQGQMFRDNWIQQCKKNGVTSVWICIDGSNDDCDAEQMYESEEGHDKSGNNGPVVGYMWAVSSMDGTPITYTVYRGSRVDSVALMEMIAYLKEYEIETEGVILDRGFWTIDDIRVLLNAHVDFIVMMKDGIGKTEMIERYGSTLRSNDVAYMLNRRGSYGVVDTVRVFRDCADEFNVGLMYNNARAAKAINDLTDKVKAAISKAEEKVSEHKDYTFDRSVREFITVTKHRGRKGDTFEINKEKLQDAVDRFGFAALATSKPMTAQKIDDVYALRQHSERQYAAFKSQLGYDVLRVYAPDSWHSKFACGFVAGILRNEFENRCAIIGTDANAAMKELAFIIMARYRGRRYLYVRLMSRLAKSVFAQVGLVEGDMNLIVEEENKALEGPYGRYPIHKLPVRETVKRGVGRPKGSKNRTPKKQTTQQKQSKPRGRPKGSKNKKTIAAANAQAINP